ncbi:MAG: CoA transferase [Burkholderiaceae bacterium]
MTQLAIEITTECLAALGLQPPPADVLRFTGDGALESRFPVTELAAASQATVALVLRRLIEATHQSAPSVTIDRRLASGWFQPTIRPLGWEIPGPWDSIAGDYRCRDGWIRLHTNAPLHRAAAQRVLGAHDDKAAMASAVAQWQGEELETSIVQAGGCAARMLAASQWQLHPQGSVVNHEPLIDLQTDELSTHQSKPDPAPVSRPLHGVKVLDLTRVLAGPVATRLLAGYGAQVLRLDPLDWDEPAVVPDVTLGKRCARLNLRTEAGQAQFQSLLSQADVLVHGYRADALERLGLDGATRRAIRPGLVDVCLNAYGWQGPWAHRRGFDSLVQMSSGIAELGMRWRGVDSPVPLPVQALDYATGFLMAASAIEGLTRRRESGHGLTARLSLARTAALLFGHLQENADDGSETIKAFSSDDYSPATEQTTWGPAKRLKPAIDVSKVPMHWETGASQLGTHEPVWMS